MFCYRKRTCSTLKYGSRGGMNTLRTVPKPLASNPDVYILESESLPELGGGLLLCLLHLALMFFFLI